MTLLPSPMTEVKPRTRIELAPLAKKSTWCSAAARQEMQRKVAGGIVGTVLSVGGFFGTTSVMADAGMTVANDEARDVATQIIAAQDRYSDLHGSRQDPDYGTMQQLHALDLLPEGFNSGTSPAAIDLNIAEALDGESIYFYVHSAGGVSYGVFKGDDGWTLEQNTYDASNHYQTALHEYGSGGGPTVSAHCVRRSVNQRPDQVFEICRSLSAQAPAK